MRYTFLFLFLIANILINAQQKYTISGYIKDSNNGEELIGATVYVKELKNGTISNPYGFYSITLKKSTYNIHVSFIGYKSFSKTIELEKSTKLNIILSPESTDLDDVNVFAEKKDANIRKVEMSTNKLDMKVIKLIPALMGEVDIIKSIQMLPGVQSSGEGSTGFYVRGGGVDQNLILLDEATVYNASHLGGLFSVFNQDAVKNLKLYKGAIPAEYGGRLSSVLDIRMKDGNLKKFSAIGGIGLISSRLTLESPILKDKSSFVLSGRRTYIDLFFPLFNNEGLKDSKAYFYDLNAKINLTIDDNNRIFISGYFGKDVFSFSKMMSMMYGNTTLTLRYNHLFSDKVFSNITFIYSHFDYGLESNQSEALAFNWNSDIIDFSFKNDYTYYMNPNNTLKFGYGIIYHTFKPGYANKIGEESIFNDLSLPDRYALEYSLFAGNEHKINDNISLIYGIHFSGFSNMGKDKYYIYNKDNPNEYIPIDTMNYSSGKIYNTFVNAEPRLGIRFKINSKSSIKASYSNTVQYIHLATNTTSVTPLDVWFPSSSNIKPQKANQFAIGYFRNFKDNTYEMSVELYYKKMNNTIDFRDHAQLLLNKYFEGELRVGTSYSYGAEFLLKKQVGKFTGWLSYTYSKTMRKIPEINGGEEYRAPYDKPHDISIILSYSLTKRLTISTNWVYSTGAPRTMPTGRFEYSGMIAPVYSDRNAIQLPDYHRMDLSVTLKGKKYKKNGKLKRIQSELNFSVYNVYDRHNAYSINFKQSETNRYETEAEKFYLFRIFPSITYNFKF